MKLKFTNDTKKYVKLHCNNRIEDYSDCPEVQVVLKWLKKLNPNNVLEIGAGLGRVSVYLKNACKWNETKFYLLDGDSGDKQIAYTHDSVSPDHFYNSIKAAKDFCTSNGIENKNLVLLNAEKEDWLKLQIKFDLVYSFKAIGFHWPINDYLNKIYKLLVKDAILIFDIRRFKNENTIEFNCKQFMMIDNDKYKFKRIAINKNYDKSMLLILQKR